MARLDQRDMAILHHYVEEQNRELYWNYLAQHEGNDGYGLLALGVVRNDSMPGAVANNLAQNHARSHDDRVPTEPEWEEFGQDLIDRDLTQRKYWMEQHRPDRALNLPVKDIQSAHAASFEPDRINPTPRTPPQSL